MFLDWFYRYSLCSASTTIVSGATAERIFVDSYMIYAILMSSIIQPVVAAWTNGGWLNELGFRDAAGSGYIHLIGGVCGLVGTSILGPRAGIFDKTTVNKLVKAASLKKKLMNKKEEVLNLGHLSKKEEPASNISQSNTMTNSNSNDENRLNDRSSKGSQSKDLKNFYNFDEETPMKFRIFLFRQQFKEFSSLKVD